MNNEVQYRVTYIHGNKRHTKTMNYTVLLQLQRMSHNGVRVTSYRKVGN